MTDSDPRTIARSYIETVGSGDLSPLGSLFDDGLVATFFGDAFGKVEWTGAIARLLPALVRKDIRGVFDDGDRVCVVYDFDTDTPAGAVPCIELVTVTDGRISALELFLDRMTFGPVNAELQERASAR